jgi:deazaflavin-dependent oxidoreductase (nitroreductase family)
MTYSPVVEKRLRTTFRLFNKFMILIWRLGLGRWGNANPYSGYVMVIKHIGRKSGLIRYTPVNYAVVDGDVYCLAGFGENSDWYRNILQEPHVELWLPDERWLAIAEDATDHVDRVRFFREVLIASGFAGPLFGVNPRKMTDADLNAQLGQYRLVRFRRMRPQTGPGGPGDLAWLWPLSTFVLIGLLIRKGKRRT